MMIIKPSSSSLSSFDYDDYDQTTTTSLVLWRATKLWAKPGLTTTWQEEGAAGRG